VIKVINKIKQEHYFLKKIIVTTFSRGLAALGTFFLNFILAKTLSIDDYGNYILVYTMMIGVSFVVQFGMPTAILRFASILFENKQFNQIKALKKKIYKLMFFLSLITISIVLLFRETISRSFFDQNVIDLIIIFCVILPIYSLVNIQSSFFKAYKKPEIAPFFEVGLTAFFTSVIVYIANYFKLESITKEFVAYSYLLSMLIVVLYGYFKLHILEKTIIDEGLDTKYSFFTTLPDYALSSITTYLLKFSPVLVLGYYVTEDKVALYSLANSITFTISFILWIISTVYAPHYANLYHNNKLNDLVFILRRSMLYVFIVAIPIFLLILFLPVSILNVFGEKYISAKIALQIMAVAQLFNISTGPVYFLLNMTGHQKKLRNIIIATSIFSVITSLLLIPKFGFMGAVYSTSTGLVMQNSLAFYHAKKLLGIKII
jgi:O-antigen/teichoic acid export membrane protein